MEKSRELRHPLLVRVESEAFGDGEHELDDVAAVRAGVRVVRLDHVAQQLLLGPGATALSSRLPVSLLDPWIRFFARSTGANAPLRVQVIFHGLLGNLTGLLNIGTLSPGSYANWSPTQRVLSALALPLGTTSAQVQFTSLATAGNWLVDDTYLDPCVAKLG